MLSVTVHSMCIVSQSEGPQGHMHVYSDGAITSKQSCLQAPPISQSHAIKLQKDNVERLGGVMQLMQNMEREIYQLELHCTCTYMYVHIIIICLSTSPVYIYIGSNESLLDGCSVFCLSRRVPLHASHDSGRHHTTQWLLRLERCCVRTQLNRPIRRLQCGCHGDG